MTASTAANAPSAFAATWNGVQDNVFTPICTQCHIGAAAPLGLRLEESVSYDLLITQQRGSVEQPNLLTVAPGNPDGSYLVRKIEGWPSIAGGRMPLGISPLPQATINVIRNWIAAGAPRTKASASGEPRAAPDSLPPRFWGSPWVRSNGSAGAWVNWLSAADDQTPPEALDYLVYAAPLPLPLDDTVPLLQTAPGATSCYLSGLAPATSYRVGIRARDLAGNLSDRPGEALLTTGLFPDAAPPRFTGLNAVRAQDSSHIYCEWPPAVDDYDPSDALVYRVTWAESGSPVLSDAGARTFVTAPGVTHAILSDLNPATRYRIAVSAGDTSGNWSSCHESNDITTPP